MKKLSSEKQDSPHTMNTQLKYHQFNSSSVFEFLENDRLGISHPTSYFPFLQKYTKRKMEWSDNIQWFHRYKLIHVNNTPVSTTITTEPLIEETDIAHRMFRGKVLDIVNRKKIYKGIFFKLSHILNPALIITNYYGENCQRWTIDRLQTAKRLSQKMYSHHNSAYIESFACLLTSRLVEKNVSPHFPLLFGIYSGTAKKMYSDYTEEYIESKGEKWFKKGIEEKRFNIIKKTFDDSSSYNSSCVDEEDVYLHSNTKDDNNNNVEQDDSSCSEEELDEEDNQLVGNEMEDEDQLDEEEEEIVEEDNEITLEQTQPVEENELDRLEDNDDGTTTTPVTVEKELPVGDLALLDLDNLPNINLEEESSSVSECQILLETYNVPVQIMAVERFHTIMEDELYQDIDGLEDYYLASVNDMTIDNAHQKVYRKKISEFDEKWIAITAQICMALISMQHHYGMIHNDLHNQNVMLHATKKEFLYYKVKEQYYKIPTYGFIVKIIDFGRATFTFRNKEIMSDVFSVNEDAGEQYTYLNHPRKKDEEIVKPNFSFDLCRLACSIAQDGEYDDDEDIYQDSAYFRLMLEWINDKDSNPITRFQGFDLYKMIAREIKGLVPFEVIARKPFTDYLITERPTGQVWIYNTC